MTHQAGVVGIGYVGLTTAVCLAQRGLDTVCVDIDADKIAALRGGASTIDEPGIADLLRRNQAGGRLRFDTAVTALTDADVVFVCVPTPSGDDGAADLRAVYSVVDSLGRVLGAGSVIAMKSTVPVGTSRHLAQRLAGTGVAVCSVPEFLREGHAVADFQGPDRVVIGALNAGTADTVASVLGADPAITQMMTPESAELAKYASNSYLAVKLSFVNSLAHLCARTGADIGAVTRAMGADPRIGPQFLRPGPGWGGSCLPKDTAALVHTGVRHGVALPEVSAARSTNDGQPGWIRETVECRLGRPVESMRVAALGLTFKAGTSDVRDSPALLVCGHLAAAGAHVQAYDPKLAMIDERTLERHAIVGVDDPYRAAKGAELILVLTEWPEFRDLNWMAIARNAADALVVDTRNLLDGPTVEASGLLYLGNGVPQR
jgi:UDPglucose 6-dehydrogenase